VAERGVWLEGRLWAGPPWATYGGGSYWNLGYVGQQIAPFAGGYKFGRFYCALGLDVSLLDDGSNGPSTATAVWLAPTAGFVLMPARRHRPSLYVEGAVQLLFGGSKNPSREDRILGIGGRLAGGVRAFFVRDVGVGLELGLAYDRLRSYDQVLQGTGPSVNLVSQFGLYGAVTLVVILG